ERHRPKPPGVGRRGGVAEPLWLGDVLDGEERRTVRFDCDNSLDQIRACVGDRPAESSRLGVRQEDRRADLVQQRQNGIAVQLLLQGEVLNGRQLRSKKLIEDWISDRARSWPLRMKMRLRPKAVTLGCDKALLRIVGIKLCGTSVHVSFVSGAASSWLFYDIHGIALSTKKLGPPLAAVRRASEVGPRLAAPVDHDNGPRMCLAAWNLELGVQVAAHHSPAVDRRVLPSGEQIALTGNRERRGVLILRDRLGRCRGEQRDESQHADVVSLTEKLDSPPSGRLTKPKRERLSPRGVIQ